MVEFIPYVAGIVTLLSGFAFAFAITQPDKKDN
jgi:hypothetical protein